MDVTLITSAAEYATQLGTTDAVVVAGIFDKVTTLSAEAENAVKSVITVALIVFVAYVTFRDGFRLGRLITAGLVAGLCAWLVWGGIFTVRDRAGEDLEARAVPAIEERYDPGLPLRA